MEKYRNFNIFCNADDPEDHVFFHEDWEGHDDNRCGTGRTLQDCKNAIDDMHCTCDECDGSGKIVQDASFSVDSGKWKRSFEDSVTVPCDKCNGSGEVLA